MIDILLLVLGLIVLVVGGERRTGQNGEKDEQE